MLEVLEFESW